MLLVALWFMRANIPAQSAGTWTPLAHQPPTTISLLLLLTDGTVMAADGYYGWYRLRPDLHGSYVNGTWSSLASMHDSRFAAGSVVLIDGRVLMAGGEYGTGRMTSEIYDPLTDKWTMS